VIPKTLRRRREYYSGPVEPVLTEPWRRRKWTEQMIQSRTRGLAQRLRLQPHAVAARGVSKVGRLGAAMLRHSLPHCSHSRSGSQCQARSDD
ncbi:hypothetical protein PHJA_000838800, partial [Phtheirospermum japonicum]